MQRLWILSDLHLEAVPHPKAFRPKRLEFDVLVVTGDVWQGDIDRTMRTVAGRRMASRRSLSWVTTSSGTIRSTTPERTPAAGRHRVVLLDDAALDVAGLRFVGGMLWGDGQLAGRHATPDLPTGERIVAGEGRVAHPITNKDQTALHRITRFVIEAAVAAPDPRPLVVVMHHAPHPSRLLATHRTGWVAGHSASDPSHLTGSGRFALWVHGHTHETTDQVRPGGTRILSNAAGVHEPGVQGRLGHGYLTMKQPRTRRMGAHAMSNRAELRHQINAPIINLMIKCAGSAG